VQSGVVSGLMGLAMSLREMSVKVPKLDGASAKGWLVSYCNEQVRWRGGRQLHSAAVTAVAKLGRPCLLPSNHDDQKQHFQL
jgi:hypothetical protein